MMNELEQEIANVEERIEDLLERLGNAEYELEELKEQQAEELRRDEKNGLYPDQYDIAN